MHYSNSHMSRVLLKKRVVKGGRGEPSATALNPLCQVSILFLSLPDSSPHQPMTLHHTQRYTRLFTTALADGSPRPPFTTRFLSLPDASPHQPMTLYHNQRYPRRFTTNAFHHTFCHQVGSPLVTILSFCH